MPKVETVEDEDHVRYLFTFDIDIKEA